MTENHESDAEQQTHNDTTTQEAPGEGGHYINGDYGDAGTPSTSAADLEDGSYEDGNYGGAGTAGTSQKADAARASDAHDNTTP